MAIKFDKQDAGQYLETNQVIQHGCFLFISSWIEHITTLEHTVDGGKTLCQLRVLLPFSNGAFQPIYAHVSHISI